MSAKTGDAEAHLTQSLQLSLVGSIPLKRNSAQERKGDAAFFEERGMTPAQARAAGNAPGWMKWAAAAIIALFLILGVWYSLTVPPFETPDEVHHYAFARNIAQGRGLPVQTPEGSGPWAHEGSQPPLYYLLAGGLTAAIDQSDFDALSVVNPRANIGDPLFPGNKNYMLHSGGPHPLQGANLALHVGRWLSLILGAITLWLVYRIGLLAMPRWPLGALLALALAASIPQFIFISASFTNDNAIIVTSTAVIYWLARLLVREREKPVQAWEWLVLGLLLGLAALSKLPGLGLFGLAGLAVLFMAWRRRNWRMPFTALLLTLVPTLAIAGWWYWRNQALYGSWLGVNELLAANGLRQEPLTWGSAKGEFRGLRYSFWGLFGWFNILLPGWVYPLMDALSLIALAGLAVGFVRGWPRPAAAFWNDPATWVRALLALWAAMILGLIAYWATFATSSQGRLLFPAISAFAILMVLGLAAWTRWLPARIGGLVLAALPLLLAGCSLYTVAVTIPDAYRAPAPVVAIPAGATAVDLRFEAAAPIRLHAVTLPDKRFRPGERVPVTLYLSTDAPLDQDYQLFIQLLDDQGRAIGNVTTHPGWGRNPTSLWTPGAIYGDEYDVLIDQPIDNRSPLLATVYVGFIDPATEASRERLPLPAFDAAGERVTPFVGHVVVEPSPPLEFGELNLEASAVRFGDVIELGGYSYPPVAEVEASEPFTVTLFWNAIGQPATDYTTFVHLRDPAGETVASYDQAPAGERFPTRYWRASDRIVSEFPLSLPSPLEPGAYELWVGLYESASQGDVRLPVTDDGGLRSGDGEVMVGEIVVE